MFRGDRATVPQCLAIARHRIGEKIRMPRHKPAGGDKGHSQKAKKKQMQEKREKKRAAEGAARADAPDSPDEDGVEDVRARMTTSLGKSGHVNAFSTVFVKETAEAVELRRNTSDEPIDMSRRSKGLFALAPNRCPHARPPCL